MKRNRILFPLLVLLLGLFSSVHAQERYADLTFVTDAALEYQLLLSGEPNTSVQMVWGNGVTVKKTFNEKGVIRIADKLKDRTLKIIGDIHTMDCSGGWIEKIDVRTLDNLTLLGARKCPITQIDLSQNANLSDLAIEDTPLEALDLSGCPKIRLLLLSANEKLKSVKLPAKREFLEEINLGNDVRITEIELKNSPKLKSADLSVISVPHIDLSGCSSLTHLRGKGPVTKKLTLPVENQLKSLAFSMSSIEEIDLSHCDKLTSLDLSYNKKLKSLDCSKLLSLVDLACPDTAIKELDLSHCPKLASLSCEMLPSLTVLDVSKNKELTVINCHSTGITRLHLDQSKIQYLDCSMNQQLAELTLPATLTDLDCSSCNLENIDISKCAELTSLVCTNNQLKEINLSTAPKLLSLICSNNQLPKLDISTLSELSHLVIAQNPLSQIVLGNHPNLKYVKANNIKLSVCGLDSLYAALPKFLGEPMDPVDHLIENNIPDVAPYSKTDIAAAKGWHFTTTGDGTGCTTAVAYIRTAPLALSPNPATEQVTISGIEMGDKVAIYSSMGELLLERTAKSSDAISIPTSSMPDGQYLVVVSHEDTAETLSLIVAH